MREPDRSTENSTDPPPPRSAFPIATAEQDKAPTSGFREGLPETYRSRHDAHYVEALSTGLDGQPVRMLPLTRIEAPPPPDAGTLGDLARSIAEFGILQPLLVRPHDGCFWLIAGRRRLAAARLAGLTAVPCLVHVVNETRALLLTRADNLREAPRAPARDAAAAIDEESIDPRTAKLIGELQDAMASVHASLRQMSTPDKMRERVAFQLMAAEVARAEWLLRARQYLGATDLVAHARLRGVALIDDVKRAADAVISLRGGTLQAHVVRGPLFVHGDRTLLSTSVVGLTWAVFALGERVRDARVLVRLASPPGAGGPVLTVTQPSAVLVGRALSRFFESSWADRPGGAAAELAARLARHAAAVHGAHLEVSSHAGAGTRVTMTFGN